MCGDVDEAAALSPETPYFDLGAVLDDDRLAMSCSVPECDAFCRDNDPGTIGLRLNGLCYCAGCPGCS